MRTAAVRSGVVRALPRRKSGAHQSHCRGVGGGQCCVRLGRCALPYPWARSLWTQGYCRCTSRDARSGTHAAAFRQPAVRACGFSSTDRPALRWPEHVCASADCARCEQGPAMCLLHGPCRCCRPLVALVSWVFFPWIYISDALPNQWRRQCRQSVRSTAAQYQPCSLAEPLAALCSCQSSLPRGDANAVDIYTVCVHAELGGANSQQA